MTIPILFTLTLFSLFVLILVTAVFLVAQLKANNSIMDIAYGPIFLFAGVGTALILTNISPVAIVVLLLVAIWSIRLGWRIRNKNKNRPEDERYANWRHAWQAHGKIYFIVRSYLQINLLQGFIIVLISLPIILSLNYTTITFTELPWLKYSLITGAIIFFVGFILEAVADWQLDRFLANKRVGKEPSPFMTSGLFRYSRRPNYFGETVIWWGLAIIVLPLPFGYLALISPLVITYIVTKITGPMLEQLFLNRYSSAYQKYQAQTSYFIPWWPRSD